MFSPKNKQSLTCVTCSRLSKHINDILRQHYFVTYHYDDTTLLGVKLGKKSHIYFLSVIVSLLASNALGRLLK